jgi:LAO/AO transport system kinase
MDKQAIIEKAKARLGADGKITCEQAMKLADAEGVSYGDMGDVLNEFKIKVGACQLHCFPNPVCSPTTK